MEIKSIKMICLPSEENFIVFLVTRSNVRGDKGKSKLEKRRNDWRQTCGLRMCRVLLQALCLPSASPLRGSRRHVYEVLLNDGRYTLLM